MIQQAIACDDPVIFFEPKRRYWEKAEVDPTAAAAGPAAPGPGACGPAPTLTVARTGRWCRSRWTRPTAAEEDGRQLEVIDLRSLSPLDSDPVLESVRRTGRLVVVHEAPVTPRPRLRDRRPGHRAGFYSLEAPVLRVGGFDTPYPPSRLEEEYLPDLDRVLDAVDRSFAF